MRHSWCIIYPCVVSLECGMPFMLSDIHHSLGLSHYKCLVVTLGWWLWLSHILWLFLLSKLHLGRGIVKPCPGEIFLLLNFCGLLGINLFYCLYIFSVQLPMINPWGWGDYSVFAMEAQGSEFNPQNPVTLILPCAWSPWTRRWRQGDPWGQLASRSHLICKLWVQ